MTMITVICRLCNDWSRSSPHGTGLLQALQDHRQECQARIRAIFYARNHVKEETP
jgi:hypothetical protein